MSTLCVNECGRYKNPFVANANFCGKSCKAAYEATGSFPTKNYTGTMCDNCYHRLRHPPYKFCGITCGQTYKANGNKPTFKYKGTGPSIVNSVYGIQLAMPIVQPIAMPIVPQVAIANTKHIGYDFDGVIHKSVYFDDKGQGQPNDYHSGDNECFVEIIELIKVCHKLGYKQSIITNRGIKSLPYVRQQLDKCFGNMLGLAIFPDVDIKFVHGDKSNTIRSLMLDEFYDDSPNKIAEISKNINTFKQGFTLYQTFPLEANNKIRKIISNGNIIPVNENIKVMTYNVCWEALEGMNGNIDMEHCKTGGRNLCMENIGNIISTYGVDSDFIALQEIKDVPTQWQMLKNHISILGNMMVHVTRVSYLNQGLITLSNAGLITLYNKNKFRYIKHIEKELTSGRPYVIILFQNKLDNSYIVFINLHYPHGDSGWIDFIGRNIKNLREAEDWSDYKVIMCGDFNTNTPVDYNKFLGTIGMKNMLTRDLSKEPGTCCMPPFGSHSAKFDHIFSNFSAPIQYTTIDPALHGKFKSDHLPIIAEFSIPNNDMNVILAKTNGTSVTYDEPYNNIIKMAHKKNQSIDFIYNNERHKVIFDSVNTKGKNVLYLV